MIFKSMDETEGINESIPKINRQTYDLTKILGKNKQSGERISIEDLQREIKIIKSEVKDLKGQLQKDAKRIKFLEEQLISESSSSSNEEKEDEDDQNSIGQLSNKNIDSNFIMLLQEITSKKKKKDLIYFKCPQANGRRLVSPYLGNEWSVLRLK